VKDIETAASTSGSGADLAPEELARIGEYLESPQFENISYSLASILIVQKAGRKADDAITAIKDELRASLQAIAGPATANIFTDAIFAAILYAVGNQAANIIANQQSPRVQAEAVKVAASIAAASSRNTQLLKRSTQIAEYFTFESELRAQIQSLHGTMRIPHAGTTRQVPYDELFIPPRLAFAASGSHSPRPQGVSLERLLQSSTRSIILGDPGGGKSTLTLKLAYDIASGNITDVTARLPLLVILRDYAQQARGANRISILEYLHNVSRTPYAVNPPENALEYLLLNGRALVIFDGLDELIDTSLRRDVVQAVEGFAYRYPTTQILVTSRRVGYEEAPLDPDLFPALQLMELTADQVAAYAHKWFGLDEGQSSNDRERLADSFIRDSEFVSDLRMNPLMLSLMCGIYATENYIPRNRPDVYEKCALLLFERWDKQRGIQSPLSFETHVYAAMRSLAFYMYCQEQPQLRREELVNFIKGYLLEKRFDNADVAEAAAEEFIDFCKGRAWVLTDVGEEKYGFTHRTFLEYFSASQLVRLHPGADQLFAALRDRLSAREWDVVGQLALQILGRAVEDGADDFLHLIVETASSADPPIKVNLLSFAARALQFIVPRPNVLRAIVTASVQLLTDSNVDRYRRDRPATHPESGLRPSAQAAVYLLAVAAEVRVEVGELIREAITDHLTENWQQEQLIAYAIIPWMFAQSVLEEIMRIEWAFWLPWSRANWTQLSKFMIKASARYYWLDVWRLGESEITVEELIIRHGVGSLFEFQIAGYGPYAPIAYELLVSRGTPLQLLACEPFSRRKKTNEIVSALNELLPTSPLPWIRFLRRYDALLLALEWQGSIVKSLPEQLILLLSAPLVELASRGLRFGPVSTGDNDQVSLPIGRRTAPRSDQVARLVTVLELRLRQAATEEEISAALSKLTLSPRVADVIRRWALGEIDFVKMPAPRS